MRKPSDDDREKRRDSFWARLLEESPSLALYFEIIKKKTKEKETDNAAKPLVERPGQPGDSAQVPSLVWLSVPLIAVIFFVARMFV